MNDEDSRIEELLTRYRPKGPPARLRERLIQSLEYCRSFKWRPWWTAAAASLILSIGLNFAAESISRDTVDMLQVQQIEWTPEAEEAAQLLNGDGWGRDYIALAMIADSYKADRYSSTHNMTYLTGDLR